MKFFKQLFALLALIMITTSSVQANPWRDCGLGAAIFPDNGTAAAIINITWDMGTTAVSSKSSSEGTCYGKSASAARFINSTYSSLETETAVGHGAHLTAVLDIYGCNAAQQADATAAIRSEFAQTVQGEGFSAKSHTEKAEAFYNAANSAAEACSAI